MRASMLLVGLMPLSAPAATHATVFPGTYTNEEDVYFAKEAGKPAPRETRIRVVREGAGFRLVPIDSYGKVLSDGNLLSDDGKGGLTSAGCGMPFTVEGDTLVALPRTGTCHNQSIMARIAPQGITLALPDGTTTLLRRARPVTCWGAVPKDAKKPDGSTDWVGVRGLKLHDQGGRAAFGGGTTGARPVEIKLRNVVWPSGPNQPSLVLYVFTPDEPDKAVGYSWANSGAARIGINLRWMQASCSVDGMESGK